MPAKWRIAIPLAVIVVVLVGASIWMFASDGGTSSKGPKGPGTSQPTGQPAGPLGPTSSTIPGQGKDTGLSAPVTGELTLYGVPTTAAALKGLKDGFEAANPGAKVTIVNGPVLDLVAQLVKDPHPGAVIAPTRAMDAIKGVTKSLGSPEPLGRNLFVIAVARGNPKGIGGIEALDRDSGFKVAACGPDSPYGNFAQIVIDQTKTNTVDGLVRSGCQNDAIKQVAGGQLDAALVMRTAKNRTVQTLPVPEKDNVVINVSIAQVGDAANAKALLTYAGSEAGTSILTDRGFKP